MKKPTHVQCCPHSFPRAAPAQETTDAQFSNIPLKDHLSDRLLIRVVSARPSFSGQGGRGLGTKAFLSGEKLPPGLAAAPTPGHSPGIQPSADQNRWAVVLTKRRYSWKCH